MLKTIALLSTVLMLTAAVPGRAQDVVVLIETNLPEAIVFADSAQVGPARQGMFRFPAATRAVRLVAPTADAWSVPPVVAALDAAPGDTLTLVLAFPYSYKIESVPFGAAVYAETGTGREMLGETPVLYTNEAPLEGSLIVEREGYLPERIEPGQKVWNRHVVTLAPSQVVAPVAAEVAWVPPKKTRRWIDYAAVGLAVGAGLVSIQQKFRADDLYDEYLKTGDPALRDRINAFDTRAAVALGAMQVGVGVFALRLILR